MREIEAKIEAVEMTDWRRNSNVKVYKMEGYVSNILSGEMTRWIPGSMIAISAPTGAGKNTFIEEVIIPESRMNGKNVLLLSNRSALGRQVKKRLCKIYGREYELDNYTDEGLDTHLREIDNLTILSYQSLGKMINDNGKELKSLVEKRFSWVIMDEAHYFISDSRFNAFTDIVLEYILNNFLKSVRIFMTATPDEIFPKIVAYKNPYLYDSYISATRRFLSDFDQNFRKIEEPKWKIYDFKRDYSYINMYFSDNDKDWMSIVKKSEYKSIIFVDSIKRGEELQKTLGEESVLVSSESKKENNPGAKTLKNIVDKERFDEKILITTAVLDNGINIKDCKVKNIVVFINDKTQFLQMIGRVRRHEDYTIDVYIPSIEKKKLQGLFAYCEKALTSFDHSYADVTSFYERYISADYFSLNMCQCTTVLSNGKYHINKLVRYKAECFDLPLFERLYGRYSEEPYPFEKEKFSWLGKEFSSDFKIGKERELKMKAELAVFLESYVEKKLSAELQNAFRKEFSEKYKKIYGKRKKDGKADLIYGLKIIKELLEERRLPYQIQNTPGYWIIKKTEEC